MEAPSSAVEPPSFGTEQATSDYHLWKRWKDSGSQEHLSDLLKAVDPIIHRTTFSRRNSGIPEQALKTHAKVLAVKAFHSYDPSTGNQLNTHLTNQLKKVSRLVYKHQDIVHIPEHTQLRITTFKNTKGMLTEQLGREPTVTELQDELHWAPRDIQRMERSLRRVLLSSGEGDIMNQVADLPDRQQEVFHLIYHDLQPVEKKVWEYTTGWHGGEVIKGDHAVGAKLGMQPTEVRKIRERIAKKFREYSG